MEAPWKFHFQEISFIFMISDFVTDLWFDLYRMLRKKLSIYNKARPSLTWIQKTRAFSDWHSRLTHFSHKKFSEKLQKFAEVKKDTSYSQLTSQRLLKAFLGKKISSKNPSRQDISKSVTREFGQIEFKVLILAIYLDDAI